MVGGDNAISPPPTRHPLPFLAVMLCNCYITQLNPLTHHICPRGTLVCVGECVCRHWEYLGVFVCGGGGGGVSSDSLPQIPPVFRPLCLATGAPCTPPPPHTAYDAYMTLCDSTVW